MPADGSIQYDPIKHKTIFAFADVMFGLLVLFLCFFEYVFVEHVWIMPKHTTGVLFVIGAVLAQVLTLMPAFAVLKMRSRIGKKLKAGEISPSFASDLSFWLVFFLWFVYLTFGQLLTFVPQLIQA